MCLQRSSGVTARHVTVVSWWLLKIFLFLNIQYRFSISVMLMCEFYRYHGVALIVDIQSTFEVLIKCRSCYWSGKNRNQCNSSTHNLSWNMLKMLGTIFDIWLRLFVKLVKCYWVVWQVTMLIADSHLSKLSSVKTL